MLVSGSEVHKGLTQIGFGFPSFETLSRAVFYSVRGCTINLTTDAEYRNSSSSCAYFFFNCTKHFGQRGFSFLHEIFAVKKTTVDSKLTGIGASISFGRID